MFGETEFDMDKKYRIGYQGCPGCNSHAAISDFTDISAVEAIGFSTFEACFDALLEGKIDTAVIPVENTLGGQVSNALDSFIRCGLSGFNVFSQDNFRFEATEECWRPIEHSLIVHKDIQSVDELEAIYTHPQASAQCCMNLKRVFQSRHIPINDGGDTAGSIPIILDLFNDKGIKAGALAPPGAIHVYPGSKILIPEMRDDEGNMTRFIHFRRRYSEYCSPPTKTCHLGGTRMKSMLLIISAGTEVTKSGYLVRILHQISCLGINLERIESRPLPASVRKTIVPSTSVPRYLFHVDVDCAPDFHGKLYQRLTELPEFRDIVVLGHTKVIEHDPNSSLVSSPSSSAQKSTPDNVLVHPLHISYEGLKDRASLEGMDGALKSQFVDLDLLMTRYWNTRQRVAEKLEMRHREPLKPFVIGFVGLGPFSRFLIENFSVAAKHPSLSHSFIDCAQDPSDVTRLEDLRDVIKALGSISGPLRPIKLVATSRSEGITNLDGVLHRYYPSMAIRQMLTDSNPDVLVIGTAIKYFDTVVTTFVAPAIHAVYKDITLAPVCIDVCSVKVAPAQCLAGQRLKYLSTHPMFGPESGKDSWQGLKLVVSEMSNMSSKYHLESIKRFLYLFARRGCEMILCTPEKHDEMAACSQFATHFLGRVIGQSRLTRTSIDTEGFKSVLAVSDNVCSDTLDLFQGLYQSNTEQCDKFLTSFHEAMSSVELSLKEDM